MHCLYTVLFLLLVVISSTLGGGCATREASRPTFRMGNYQKLLEKQKAGMPFADEALKSLPEMSVKEYEMAGDNHFRSISGQTRKISRSPHSLHQGWR
jgi:hypothetical protein